MDSATPRKHFILSGWGRAENFKTPPRLVDSSQTPPVPEDRFHHGNALKRSLNSIPSRQQTLADQAGIASGDVHDGYYLTFQIDSLKDFDVSTLEYRQKNTDIFIVASRKVQGFDGVELHEFTLHIPSGSLHVFQDKIAKYLKTAGDCNPKLSQQIDRWRSVDLTTIKQFWTDRSPFPDDDQKVWWEVWLRRSGDDDEIVLSSFRDYCRRFQITIGENTLVFDDRIVVLANATPEQWMGAPLIIAFLAEFRAARELATPFVEALSNSEQKDFATDLADRILQMGANPPAVCIVDTGVNRAHPLLEASLLPSDQHACVKTWGVDDAADPLYFGHGTWMAGLTLFGDRLDEFLLSDDQVELWHRLESVKVIPRTGDNGRELHAVRMVEATIGPEVSAADRNRVYLLALTLDDSETSGEPSLWGATVDALSSGRDVEPEPSSDSFRQLSVYPNPERARLWVLAGGNVCEGLRTDHIRVSDNHAIENPGEAWNALTVGAMTELDIIKTPKNGEKPLAKRGELSPYSRTSMLFDVDRPIKPEIVMEGGNAHLNDDASIGTHHSELSLLTTSPLLLNYHYTTFSHTSAASALAGRIGARIWADYPELWPETVRGLMVHSAKWTDAMWQHFAPLNRKADRAKLLRRYGWGVPDEARALHSLGHKLTIVCEDRIQPFDSQGRYCQMSLHGLPWPSEELQKLDVTRVRLRVTLSTFVDPHPSRRGRYGYPSHQLRFDLKHADESAAEFAARINAAMRDASYKPNDSGNDDRWYFGPNARARGSIFSDIWEGPANVLAKRDHLAVLPISGWWKDKKIDREARYSLIMSIETESQEIDLWSEVDQKVRLLAEPTAVSIAT